MTPPQRESWLHRAPRPLVMWLAVIMVVCVLVFFVAIGSAIATAFHRAAETGQSVPDMSGGIAAVMTGLAALLPALASFWQIFNQRHIERRDTIAHGGGEVPFPQPAPSQASLPEPSPETWPRPGDSTQ